MKVAIILNSFPEISEKFLLNHIVGAIRSGQDITVYAAHRSDGSIRHEAFDRFTVSERVRYLDIPKAVRKRFFQAPWLFLRLFATNPKAAVLALWFPAYRTVAKNVKLLYFGNAFASEHYDVVHCHFGVNGLIGSYLKHCGFCTALITTFHGSDINTYPKRFGMDVYKTLYATADAITANTSFTKSKIAANGCPDELISVIPVGLLCEEYKGIDRSRVDPYTLLTVGRLEEKKGHEYALRAVAILRDRFPSLHYHIAGDGSLRENLEALCAELGIGELVTFLGVATGDQVRELYSKAAVFTLPSVTASNGDMEGQGLVIQEAQMCGIPVVTTNHNGIPDGIKENVTGFLVEERDVIALAEKISLLFSDPLLRERMGKAGKEFVSGIYDIPILTDRINALYLSVLGRKAATRIRV